MKAIFEILPILTTFPYTLVYYLILLSSTGFSLLGLRRNIASLNTSQLKKLQITLFVLFFSQLIQLTMSLLIHQGAKPFALIFPIVYRALTFSSIIWLIWTLLDFSCKDWRAGIPLALTLLALLIGSIIIITTYPTLKFKELSNSWVDLTWVLVILFLILLGISLLLKQRTELKLEKMLVLIVIALGFLAYLIFPNEGTLPMAVLLSQLIYYPMLLIIAWQISDPGSTMIQAPAVTSNQMQPPLPPKVASALLDISLEKDKNMIRNALTHSLGLFLMSDLFGIVEQNLDNHELNVTNTYDLIREEYLKPFSLAPLQIPKIVSSFENGLPLVINERENLIQEKQEIIKKTGYNEVGNIMIFPIVSDEKKPTYAFLCLSPYTNKKWQQTDQDHLLQIAPKVERILDQTVNPEDQTKMLEELRKQIKQLKNDKSKLQENFDYKQAAFEDLERSFSKIRNDHESEIQIWAERQKSIEMELNTLTEQIQHGQMVTDQIDQLTSQKKVLEEKLVLNNEKITSLQQIIENVQASLNNDSSITSSIKTKVNSEKVEIHSTSESGQLNEQSVLVQKTSSQRLSDLLDNIADKYFSRKIKLEKIIDNLLPVSNQSLVEIEEILKYLAINAFTASPNKGLVSIEVNRIKDEDDKPAVEIFVTDFGGGLSKQEQANFLSLIMRSGFPVPSGVGDAKALKKAISRLEEIEGHWWIHSQVDRPTTFRVIIPVNEMVDQS